MLRVNNCAPFDGAFGANAIVFSRWKKTIMSSALWGREVTEQELFDYFVATNSDYADVLKLAGLERFCRFGAVPRG